MTLKNAANHQSLSEHTSNLPTSNLPTFTQMPSRFAFLEDPIDPFQSCCPWPNDDSSPHCTVALHEQSTVVQWGHGGPPPVTGGWLRWTKRCRVSSTGSPLQRARKRFKHLKEKRTKTHICVNYHCTGIFPQYRMIPYLFSLVFIHHVATIHPNIPGLIEQPFNQCLFWLHSRKQTYPPEN